VGVAGGVHWGGFYLDAVGVLGVPEALVYELVY
jgi:hypothetical protein